MSSFGHKKITPGGRGTRRFWAALVGVILMSLGLAGCGSRFPDPPRGGEYDRVVLLEEGTGTWCVNCPRAAENIEELLSQMPLDTVKVVVLALHSANPDTFATAETEARVSWLGITAFPTIVFDGVEKAANDNTSTLEAMLADHRKIGSPLKLELVATATADSVLYEINIEASAKNKASVEGVMRIALVQDSVAFTNAIWSYLAHVVRRMPEPVSADSISFDPGETGSSHMALVRDVEWDFPLTAVIWVEAGEDSEVIQAASSKITSESPVLKDR